MNEIILKYLSFALFLLVLFNTPANALVTWPTGPAPCNNINDIEICLNGVIDGEVIEIQANAIPSQSGIVVSSAKSFTLRAASGFTPVFAGFTSLYFPGSDNDITVVIEGLTLQVGNFRAVQAGTGTFSVTFRNNVVEDSSFSNAIEVSSANSSPPYGSVFFLIQGNTLNVIDNVASGISAGGFLGAFNRGQILNNRITANNTGQAAAISVNGSSNSTFNIDVNGNEITGQNFNSGISMRLFGTGGSLNAQAVNNVIQGQFNTSGRPAGISLSNTSSTSGHSNFEIVNNTLAFNENAISYGGRPDLGATSDATFINNIIAFNTQTGFGVGDFDATTINDFNLIFGNTSDFYNPGVNDVLADPLFVSNVDLRLQQMSPAVGFGLNSALPNFITTDIDGNMRIRQIRVDMGAYESNFLSDFIFKNSFE